MYFICKDGVKNLTNGLFVEMETKEWEEYKLWCESNEPEWGEPYEAEGIVSAAYN